LSSVPFYNCARCFPSYQNFVKLYQTSKSPSSCPGAGQIFVKGQTARFYNLEALILTENVKRVNLILLLRVNTFRQLDTHGYQTFWCFQVRRQLPNWKLAGGKIYQHFWQGQTNLDELVRTVPNWIFIVEIFVCAVTISVSRIQFTLVTKTFCRIVNYTWYCSGTLILCCQESGISNICKRNCSH